MRLLRRAAAACLTTLILTIPVPAMAHRGLDPASPTPPARASRPRIGLALGGGSARGLAHLGVLTWLDEHRIPVDYVGGTSMGALIGSTLAIGMSPDEAWAMLTDLDWASMLAPDTPFEHKSFRRKEDARAFPSLLEFGLKGGFSLPSGLTPAGRIGLLVDRMALPYSGVSDFADLPVPFACVAVDLRTSAPVTLATGRLENALRATMALPGLFRPVRIDDQILVDGGLLNNLPADVVKAMGADVVIAVDVGRDLSRPKEADTLLRVLLESLDVVMRAPTRRTLTSADVVIEPALGEMTGANYSRVTEFVQVGYDAAEANRDRLLRYAVSPGEYQAYLEARQAKRRTTSPPPTFLRIDGVSGGQAEVVRRAFEPHVGQPIDTTALERTIERLTGSDRYEAISYRDVDADGRHGLLITAREKVHAPPYLLGALDLRNAASPTVAAELRGRLTFFDVLTTGSETRVDLGVGQTTHAGAEWFLALGRQGLFVAPRASFTRAYDDLFEGASHAAEYRRDTGVAGGDVGFTDGRRFEVRAGYAWEHVDTDLRLGKALLPDVRGGQGYWRAQAIYDSQTSPVIPTRGLYARATVRRFTHATGDEADHQVIADGVASLFRSAGRRGRVFVAGSGGWAFRDHTTVNRFTLGGPFALSAYRPGALRGSNFAVVDVGYFHEVARVLEGAAARLYAGAWVESGGAFEHLSDARIRTNASGGFVMETVLGPVFLVGSVGAEGRARVYVGLGPLLRR